MDVSVVKYSVLSINNHFYKVFKRLIEKRNKNESISAELEWINGQLLHENRKICENSVFVLIEFGNYDFGLASNCLISALPRASSNYDLISNGIFKLLRNVNQQFGITEKIHPGILMINELSERMFYLSQKIQEILNDGNFEDPVKFLKPVLIMIECSDIIYAETREIWSEIFKTRNSEIIEEILNLRRVTSPASSSLFNSMALQKFKISQGSEDLLLIIISTKYLVEYSLDPTNNIEVIISNQKLFESDQHLNIAMLIFAEILQKISITFIPKFVDLLRVMIMERKFNHPVINPMILDGLIQVIAYPSFASKEMKKVEELLNFTREFNCNTKSNETPDFHHFNHGIMHAFEIYKFLDSKSFQFKKISTDHERNFWRRHQLVLRGFFHSKLLGYDQWLIVLNNLIETSKSNDELKSSLVMPLLFRLSESSDPKVKVSILQNLTQLGASTEVFSTIKALSQGMLRSMAIDLHLRLWKIEPRTYPFLYKVLVEKSSRDDEDFYLSIIQASAIKEICDLKPHHGSDLVTLISDILNKSLESKDCEIQAALAIDAIIILCENHIINITSTWKAISVTTRYEKRPRVVESLCKFFALVPKLKRNNSEFELFMKEIVERIFYMIQWSDMHGIECALEAFKSWRYDQLTLDMIPDTYREGIALPEAGVGMEVSILDLEVPGDCFVQMLTKVKALSAVGDLISHFIAQEILDYRSGTYIVKEGQPEPMNYKNLPKQSIVKAVTQFVTQQATTRKTEKIFSEEILIEALKILARKYFRPLPPLNWTFLHEIVHKSQEVKAQCLAIVSKQSVISGTAKRLAENILININFDDCEDVENALEILPDLCNGIANDVLKIFFEKAVKNEKINESMQNCLRSEKDITNRENFAAIISIYVKSSAKTSKETIKLIPSNIMPMISLESMQKIEFRCEILKENSKVENAVGWINELITEQYSKDDHRELFIENFIDLITHSKQSFPKMKWLSEFMTMTENKMIEKGNLNFLLDIFCTAMICFSGCFDSEIFSNRLRFFPHAVEMVSCQENFTEMIGSILDFIYFVIDHNSIPESYQKAFKGALIATKNHSHFKKAKTWNKVLQAVAISKS